MNDFVKNVLPILKVIRPIHWTKNLAVFAALLFSEQLLNPHALQITIWAFICFNLAASACYVLNDLIDAKRDSLHPIKKTRPIASGALSRSYALVLFLVLAGVALIVASSISILFLAIIATYITVQVCYSLLLKNIAVIDILVIASGFIMRIYAGAVVVDAHLSVWFLLCVISVALFLAAGKRRAELGVVTSGSETRKSLSKYSKELLNSYVTMFGNAAWMSWALFTFFESPKANEPVWLFLAEISRTTTINKLLMVTIPLVIFAIMRYTSLIFEERSEAPEKLFLTDIPLVASVGIWGLAVVWILYGGVSL